ncbi:MAG: CoA transferase, partial [Acidimicrobiaceae bacterium]|nr:CoA transferase [Acidimicrobiaceae bacterium]
MMGPVATQLLADHGADVLKIERPGSGDIFRQALVDPDGAEHPAFGALNRNKRSMVVDVRSPEGLGLIDDLVAAADVVVNNYRPEVMDRLGLGYERLSGINPRIVYAQGTGFGTGGVYARKGGQDILAQALTGAMSHKADPGHPTAIYPVSLADYTAGMHMVQGILMALLHRTRTGRGQRVEVSLYDSLLAMQILEATMALMGRDPL